MLTRALAGWILPVLLLFQEGSKPADPTVPFTVTIKGDAGPKTIQGKLILNGAATTDTVTVSSGWFWDSSEEKPFRPWDDRSHQVRDGRLEIEFKSDADALFAFDEKNRMGAIQVLKGLPPGQEVVLDVKPLIEVRGEFICRKRTPPWAKAEIHAEGPGGQQAPIASYYFENGTGKDIRLLLPAGKYQALLKGTGAQHRKLPFSIDGKESVFDLKRIELRPNSIGDGSVPDVWKVTAARGVGKDVKLSDYRGKWVLLEFWGYW